VFEPFYTSKPHGLGMGLPISRSIVEAHGGRLWVENNPGGAATFTFSLPVAAKEGTRDDTMSQRSLEDFGAYRKANEL
jgi:two-component system, LuxR family, sensor kinase FixL